MLREFKNVSQPSPAERRRWFESDKLELIVWHTPTGAMTGFQIVYAFAAADRGALTWRVNQGFAHSRIDEGEDSALKNCTPVLVPTGTVPLEPIRDLFVQLSTGIEPDLRNTILQLFQPASAGFPN